MKAVRVHELGDVDVLCYEEIPMPGPGQALVKVEAIGLNFIDCYLRKGLYKTPLPFIPGMEASGERSEPPVRTSPTFAWETG
jgi:NADPH2:quinone reductase